MENQKKNIYSNKNYLFLDIINLKYIFYKNKMEINVKIVKVAKTDYLFILKC